MKLLKLVLFMSIASLQGCQKLDNEPTIPSGLPSGSVWIGGSDGGVFANCKNLSNSFQCAFFDEQGGRIEQANFEGKFDENVQWDFYDGQILVTIGGKVYKKS